jgi:peptide/nickel transport system permease protein
MTSILVFVFRRAAAGVFTVFLMITVTFVIFWATPTQPARFVYPTSSHLSNYQITHGDHLLGVDKPKLEQWFHYITHVPLLRFGHGWEGVGVTGEQTLTQGVPIGPLVLPSMRVTLSLLLGGAGAVLLLAIPLGAFAGRRIGSIGDRAVSIIVLVGICTHPMVVGILVRVLFAGQLHWLPPHGYCPLVRPAYGGCGGVVDWADHLALPWLTFALLFLALYVRIVRSTVADTLNEDFVRTARAKGASELRVLTRHVLPNATSTIVTMIGLEIGTALGVCIFIETAYSLPGLSSAAVRAMAGATSALDLPLILAIIFLLTLIVVIGNLVVDAVYAVIDPRIAFRRDSGGVIKATGGGIL